MKNCFLIVIILFFFSLLSLSSPKMYALYAQNIDKYNVFTNSQAKFFLNIPSSYLEKSKDESRIVFQSGSDETGLIILKINYVYIGVNMDYGEYIKILADSKKSEGMEPQTINIKGGNGFTYEARTKKNDEDINSIYLIALSNQGWICTLTFTGKWSALKKEYSQIQEIIQSFQFTEASSR